MLVLLDLSLSEPSLFEKNSLLEDSFHEAKSFLHFTFEDCGKTGSPRPRNKVLIQFSFGAKERHRPIDHCNAVHTV